MAANSIVGPVIGKVFALQRRLARLQARRFTRKHTPILFEAYEAFGTTSQSGVPRQPLKGWELWKILERFRPRKLIELGSGATSAVFALYANTYRADYLCLEHSPEWAAVTERCLRQAGLIGERSPIEVSEMYVADDGSASGFKTDLSPDFDFVYVDGPPCPIIGGVKRPNNDVVRLFEAGGLPRCIVVDGRLETVDFIRGHARGVQYQFLPSYVYSARRGAWRGALGFREHTILYRTT